MRHDPIETDSRRLVLTPGAPVGALAELALLQVAPSERSWSTVFWVAVSQQEPLCRR